MNTILFGKKIKIGNFISIIIVLFTNCDFLTDIQKPDITITSPLNGDTLINYGQLTIPIEIQATDNKAIDYVNLFYKNQLDTNSSMTLLCTFPEIPFNASYIDSSTNSHFLKLKASAYDVSGNWKNNEIEVYIKTEDSTFYPFEVGYLNTPGTAVNLFVNNSTAYIADYSGGLRIIDVSDAANPYEIGYFISGNDDAFYDVKVQGNYAYIACCNYIVGLRIINISNPSSPYQVGSLSYPRDESWGLAIDNTVVYQGFYDRGWCTINVSNPASPQEMDYYGTGRCYGNTFKEGIYVYAISEYGLRIFDVSNSTNIICVASINAISPSTPDAHMVKIGNYLYAFTDWKMYTYDVSNPASPVYKNEYIYDNNYCGYGLYADNNILYSTYKLYSGGGALGKIDISNPIAPTVKTVVNLISPGYSLVVVDKYAYIACGENGLRIYQIKP